MQPDDRISLQRQTHEYAAQPVSHVVSGGYCFRKPGVAVYDQAGLGMGSADMGDPDSHCDLCYIILGTNVSRATEGKRLPGGEPERNAIMALPVHLHLHDVDSDL